MFKRAIAILLLAFASASSAGYNATIQGVVKDVLTYPSGVVLFRLSNQPTTHPLCRPEYFSIGTAIPQVEANRMLSRLLLAYTLKETVQVGFDDTGDCAVSYIRVHRVG
jgi:hypothetical protein